ncbi:uncharacterized protein LOC143860719 [Tasmannia lanceolata]|uniref:uncharacterized protein LOC143860719 n=1 Tax=Tasmannia lanceolata TaxID=3420 RepID=UPI004062BDF0
MAEEKLGKLPPNCVSTSDFQDAVEGAGLIDVGYVGNRFTRCNNQINERCGWARLDRVFTNSAWITDFQSTTVTHLSRTCSDHCPLLLDLKSSAAPAVKPFKFQSTWCRHADFQKVLSSARSIPVDGTALELLAIKLKNTKRSLKSWNKDQFGNIFQNVKDAEDLVTRAENIHQDDINQVNTATLEGAREKLKEVMLQEEIFMRQKSKDKWSKEGDRKTKFFHASVQLQRKYGGIRRIFNDNSWEENPQKIKEVAAGYFNKALQDEGVLEDEEMLDSIPCLLSAEDNNALTQSPTVEEVKEAVFGCPEESAPGPDGLNGIFFIKCWDIIKEEVIEAAKAFFAREQGAFVKGRCISDNISIAQEMMGGMGRKVRGGNVMLKINMAKVYDRLNWGSCKVSLRISASLIHGESSLRRQPKSVGYWLL